MNGDAGSAVDGGEGGDAETWVPANPTERALADAMVAGDHRDYFRILSTVDLFLPQFMSQEPGGQTFVTANLFGHTFLPVFTSLDSMVAQMSEVADGYTVTNYAELRRKWPTPEWRLAVNPGTPIDAYVAIEAVESTAVGETAIPTAGQVVADAVAEEEAAGPRESPPQVDVDEALTAAVERRDGEAYLRALADALVVLPTARPVADGSELFEPGFPWRRGGTPDAPTIEVFTSERLFHQFTPEGTPSLTVALPYLLGLWPEGCALSVNPGTTLGVELPNDQVKLLLMWSDEDYGTSL